MKMINAFLKIIGAALLIGMLFASISGCQQQEGPAELSGKQIDKTVDKVGQKIEKAGNSIQDTAKGSKN